MTDLKLFREYEPHECGGDGYPLVWSRGLWPWGGDDDATGDYIEEYGTVINFSRTPPPDPAPGLDVGVKDIVRMLAGHRCIRCGHPYREGRFTWAPRRPEEPAPDVQLKALNDDLAPADRAGHRTHWSPCDEHCQHSAPIRVRDQPRVEFAVPANAPVTDSRLDDVWRYWPTLRKRDALQVDPVDNAGAIVRDWKDVEAAWRVLTVHHLTGVKSDLRPFNLLACCQRCHLYLQRNVVMDQTFVFEHDNWFKPYAAAWYALKYEGRVITLGEARADLDRLLAHERMA